MMAVTGAGFCQLTRQDLRLIDWQGVERCWDPEPISSSLRHHPAVGLGSLGPVVAGESLDPECKVLFGCRRPGRWGGAGPSVLYTHGQASTGGSLDRCKTCVASGAITHLP